MYIHPPLRRAPIPAVSLGELSRHPPHPLREHQSSPNHKPYNSEDNTNRDRNPETVRCDLTMSSGRIEEVISVEALCRMRDVRNTEVPSQEKDQEQKMDPRRALSTRNKQFEKRKYGVEKMTGYLYVISEGEKSTANKEEYALCKISQDSDLVIHTLL